MRRARCSPILKSKKDKRKFPRGLLVFLTAQSARTMLQSEFQVVKQAQIENGT